MDEFKALGQFFPVPYNVFLVPKAGAKVSVAIVCCFN